MTYTRGVIESTIEAVKDRIETYTATGKSLASVKAVLIGSRPKQSGLENYPLILIRPVNYREQPVTQANRAGTKLGRLSLEIKLIADKLMTANGAKYSQNVLYNSTGGGIIALWQYLSDALDETTAGVWKPDYDIRMDTVPERDFAIEEFEKHMEIMTNIDFNLRFEWGGMAGVTS